MSVLLTSTDRISQNLVVIFSSKSISEQLFLAALEWTTTKDRKTHYVRRNRCGRDMVVAGMTSFMDPARYKRVRFYYMDDYPLRKHPKYLLIIL
ncbi:hypothetical protein KIN20_002876 [Parelaphostrongylus tenuis]|uniref:Uncharacterized protein n=1 Tax=Parelaphostrongylus tenuis TaxID=148309 RepID=A0AAD5MHF7_PARTN|nr:hypothetical protein KIN20_002876 [Parelaphostrongylus tenuis]